MNLSESQTKVIDRLSVFAKDRKPFFMNINGGPGTGKSFLIRTIVELFSDSMNISVSALTGQAAALLDGATTVHRAFSLGAQPWPPREARFGFNAEFADLIIIDEISMMSSALMAAVLERIRSMNSYPCILVVGDDCQLPPVVDRKSAEMQQMLELFGGVYWDSPGIETVITAMYDNIERHTLTTNFRQDNDREFLMLLHNIRNKNDLFETAKKFNAKCFRKCTDEKTIRLFSTNKSVDAYNTACLMKLPGKTIVSKMDIEGDVKQSDYSAVPEVLTIKVGARVMIVANIYDETDSGSAQLLAVNGDMGTIVTIGEGESIPTEVLLDRDNKTIMLTRYTCQIEKLVRVSAEAGYKSTVVGSWTQLPMKLGYAITIHKSQGQTLDKVHVDLGSWTPPGLAYVALSRAHKLEDITIAKPLMHSDLSIGKST